MAYEIPQQLKYEEKIVFGLTLEQFGAIAIVGLLAAAVYMRLNIPFEAKVVIVSLLAVVGLGFAFFDFKRHLQNLLTFYKGPRQEGYLDEKTKNFVEVREVKDNIIFLKSGEARAIVQVFPMNFAIKSETEQSAIVENFQSFLNSLTFPVQILMRTVNLNIDNYLDNLESSVGDTVRRTGNEGLKLLFKDYRNFMDKFITENAIQDRLFYVVVPVESVVKNAKEREDDLRRQMEIRTNLVVEKLATVGLRTRLLNTQQLISLLSSFFAGYIEVENDYLFPMTMLDKYAEADSYD